MARLNFLGGQVHLFDDAGNVLAGGKVYFYEPGTSTAKDTYTTSGLDTANANPVILDSAGRANIWLDGDYKVVVKDSTDNTIYTVDDLNPDESVISAPTGLVSNGSFESPENGDGKSADDWTIVTTIGTGEIDATENQHGTQSYKFVSTGSGGQQIISTKFTAINHDKLYEASFYIKSSVANVRNLVEIVWYDKDQSLVTTTSVYDESSANPTSWTKKTYIANPGSTVRYAKMRIYGCHSSNANPGTVYFDEVRLDIHEPVITKGADIASAATLTLGTDGNYFDVTGTTGITAISGDQTWFKLQFDGALTLTHSATLVLPASKDITTQAGDKAEFVQTASGTYELTNFQRHRITTYPFGEYIKLHDSKSSGTDGGTLTGATWNKRTLTEVTDSGGHCSVSSSAFTLDAGTYIINASAPAYQVANHQLRLRNTSDSTTDVMGTASYSETTDAVVSHAFIRGLFTISASKTFELQHYVNTTAATLGAGVAVTSGENEIYAIVELWKVA